MDPDSDPGGITAGPDGHLWFTEPSANKIGRITPCGDGSTVSDTATWQVQADSEP